MADSVHYETLTVHEAERLIETLQIFPVQDIGSPSWLRQHDSIERLNIQAHLNAVAVRDDYIAEALISLQKMPVLVHELIAIELWCDKVYPHLVSLDFAAKSTMTPYMVIYHEATLVSLLEAVMYNKECCLDCADTILDLVDYLLRKVLSILRDPRREPEPTMSVDKMLALSGQQQLEQQIAPLPFDIATKCVSILRYMTDNIASMPLSVITRVLNVHDFPSLLASLLVAGPWTREGREGKEKYSEGRWALVPGPERLRLTKTEAQVWLALYNLVMEPECRRKYVFNTTNVGELLKLRSFFNEVLVDQLPILQDLRRVLEQLAMGVPPAPAQGLVLEQLPELRNHMKKGIKWKAVAEQQRISHFSEDAATLLANAKRLADTYNLSTLDALCPDPPSCSQCGGAAAHRCSRCHSEWYCRRQCQVEHWPKHKAACLMMVQSAKEMAAQSTRGAANNCV